MRCVPSSSSSYTFKYCWLFAAILVVTANGNIPSVVSYTQCLQSKKQSSSGRNGRISYGDMFFLPPLIRFPRQVFLSSSYTTMLYSVAPALMQGAMPSMEYTLPSCGSSKPLRGGGNIPYLNNSVSHTFLPLIPSSFSTPPRITYGCS